jgi:hypothetical protein
LSQAIATQPVRAKQAWEIFVDRADRLPVRYRSPNQPVHLLHCLDSGFDNTHLTFTIPPASSVSASNKFIT